MKKGLTLVLFTLCALGTTIAQNTALLMDGSSENIEIQNDGSFDVGAQWTAEAWIFANNWTGQSWQGSLLNTDRQGPDSGYALRCGDNGKLSFVLSVDNQWNEIISPSTMNTQQWHHVAAVVDNGTMALYIDGQLVADGTYSGTITNSENTPVKIGASSGFGGRYFDGVIDEVRVWSTARSQAQLADNNTVDLTGSEQGLVAYFPLNEGSGTIVGNLATGGTATTINMDDSNWVSGYTLPDFDVSVSNIRGIDRVHMKTRPVRAVVSVQNVGTMPISDVEVMIAVDGAVVATQTVSETIPVGIQIPVTIQSPLDLTTADNPEITATIAHPDDANSLNNVATSTIVTRDGNFVNLFESEQHNFGSAGQLQFTNVILPGDLSNYEQILMHIDVSCPSAGCDPWDQPAKVTARTDDGEFEIARYITPFGIACGGWTVDVTDFKSVLAGGADYTSFIQVWGPSGWLATIDLELIEGDSRKYSKITHLWNDDYQVYGDPDISYDLEAISVVAEESTQESHIRMTISGHGQGNTGNAAEFFNVNHTLMVDQSVEEVHNLWKADCNTNSCANQLGSWLFPRAGWCPGQEVQPRIFNTTDAISTSGTMVDYVLQDYTNLLNTGYNNSGHTEPHYRIHSFFVEGSDTPYEDYKNMETEGFMLTLGGLPISVGYAARNTGLSPVSSFTVKHYVNNVEVGSETYTGTSLQPGEAVDYDFTVSSDMLNDGANYIYAEVIYDEDEDHGDDIVGSQFLLTSVAEVDLPNGIVLQPNPSSGLFTAVVDQSLIGGQLQIISIDGRLIDKQPITGTDITGELLQGGTYILKATHPSGHTATKRLMIIK